MKGAGRSRTRSRKLDVREHASERAPFEKKKKETDNGAGGSRPKCGTQLFLRRKRRRGRRIALNIRVDESERARENIGESTGVRKSNERIIENRGLTPRAIAKVTRESRGREIALAVEKRSRGNQAGILGISLPARVRERIGEDITTVRESANGIFHAPPVRIPHRSRVVIPFFPSSCDIRDRYLIRGSNEGI